MFFTLTLTLSLEGEGIAELRNSYQDTSYSVESHSLPLGGMVRVGVNSSVA